MVRYQKRQFETKTDTTKDAAKDSGAKKTNEEHGHMTVTQVKMVSESCQ